MTADEQEAVFDLVLKRTSEEDFLRRFDISREDGSRLTLKTLESAYREKAATDVECGLLLGFHFGFTKDHLDILCRLSGAEWHQQHENVVLALDKLRDSHAADALYRAALVRHPYLDYDDSRALAVKAIWALGRLEDADADAKLTALAASKEPIISSNASKQLRRRGRSRFELDINQHQRCVATSA